jgi:hypothetical protein
LQKTKRHDKLICERQRRGSKNKYHDYRHVKGIAMNDNVFLEDFEEDDITMVAPKIIEPMDRIYRQRWANKEFSDFTSPIKGFIHKNLGRKWDDVFSEFCAQYDQRAIINKHLFLHLKQNVCRKVFEVNGELQVRDQYRVSTLEKAYEQFYVDPRDGILKENKDYVHWKVHRRNYNNKAQIERNKTIRVIDKFTECHLINNIWFKIKFIEREGYMKLHERVSAYNPNRVSRWYVLTFPPVHDVLTSVSTIARVATTKTTASKKEIRDFKLNEPIEELLVA